MHDSLQKTKLGQTITQTNLNMSKMTQNQNREISKLLTHQVIKEVTKTMNAINFAGFEKRVNQLVLTLLEKPIRQISHSEQIITKMSDTLRRNVRRVHEIEYILEKYQRAATIVETFENRFSSMKGSMDQHGAIYNDAIVSLKKQVEEQLPETLIELQKEMNSWQRLKVLSDKELASVSACQKADNRNIMRILKHNHKSNVKEIQELKQRADRFDGQKVVIDSRLDEFSENISKVEMQAQVNKTTIERNCDDFRSDVEALTKRINKAEEDRMSKYYRQVSDLQDWKTKITEKIEQSHKMAEAVASHFTIENQLVTLN